jgi:hypothetical protein
VKQYKATFYLTSGNTASTVITADNVQKANENIFSKGPFVTFFDDKDPDNKTFTINLNNVSAIEFQLVSTLEKK